MTRFTLSPAARADLKDIGRYSRRQHGAEVGNAYVRGFAGAFARLRDHPQSAPPCPEYGDGLRCLVQGSHRIFYCLTGDGVLVVRILHHAQDAPSHLNP